LIARFQPGGILTLIKRIWSISDKAAKIAVAEGASHAP
jgi:branched-chain amino acid transport system permease protein